MSKQSFQPAQYKAAQRQLWDSVAAGWEKWWPLPEQALQCVSDRLADLAHIQPGNRVLDVGTGVGEPAITASRRVGAAGRVVATDLAPQMLAIARDRALTLGLGNLEWRATDAEAIDFPARSFDAILARFSLMYLPALVPFLTKMRGTLAPEGRFVAAIWDAAEKVPMVSLAVGLAREILQPPPPPAGAPSLFALAGGVLEQALGQAGFAKVRAETMTCLLEVPSAEVYTQFLRDVNVPIISMLADQPAERQAAYWQALAEGVQAFAAEDGGIRIPNRVICVVGQG